MSLLVALPDRILAVDPERGSTRALDLHDVRPTGLAVHPLESRTVWCGTRDSGVLRSGDEGAAWEATGLEGERVMSVAVSPADGSVWAGTEPSAVWRWAEDLGAWVPTSGLDGLPSSSEWAFPPRPETHHVRWIACHPSEGGVLWVAVEAGALLHTRDGGRTWHDRVETGPHDTHELAIHPDRPDRLRAAAGDGYFESADGGLTWSRPSEGLEVGYLRSVAVPPGRPDVVVVSASSRAKSAYVAGRSDGRVYRREGDGPWERASGDWPDPPSTIAPLLIPGRENGELWAADELGIHRSGDGGRRWSRVVAFDAPPDHLRGLVVLG